MIKKMVRYRVTANEVEAVREAIGEFVDAIAEHEPNTIYGSLLADDGVSFVHAMAFPDAEAEQRHRTAEHTKRFVELLYPKCDQEPQITTLRVVGSTKRGGGFLGLDNPD